MAKTTKFALALAAFIAASPPVQAEIVACHVTYGGTTQTIVAAPVDSPYGVAPVAIGSFFLFRIVFQTEPADLASIKLYTYANHDSGPAIIHQASYAYPQTSAAVNGFSGLIFVYESLGDSELQYWCEQK